MTLTFVTRGYVNPASTPLRFPHWGYLYREESPVSPEPEIKMVQAPSTPSYRRQPKEDDVLRDDREILMLIELFIKHQILK